MSEYFLSLHTKGKDRIILSSPQFLQMGIHATYKVELLGLLDIKNLTQSETDFIYEKLTKPLAMSIDKFNYIYEC